MVARGRNDAMLWRMAAALPRSLPKQGVELRLRFRRIPERSCIVKLFASGSELGALPVYGRGRGSSAREGLTLHLPLDAAAIARHGLRGGEPLELCVEDLRGTPLAEHDLELLDVSAAPLGE